MRKSQWLSVAALLALPCLQGCVPAIVAGAGGAVLVAEDRRSTGTMIDDQSIEGKARRRIEDKYDDQVHVDVTSFNRFVLLAGQVPTQQIKDDIGVIALGVETVRNVQNELVIGPITDKKTRANDAYITSKVKARLVSEQKFDATHIKVTTENGVVYLMGLVTKQEADKAAEVASTTGGVEKVVKVFEYIG
jgi:osmotically-inducible protein OsmY